MRFRNGSLYHLKRQAPSPASGLTSVRGAISSGDLKAKKHGRRTIILPDDLRVWLKALPGAGKPIEQSPAHVDIDG